MSDTGALPLDGEHPVNPYSLLEAVNRASDTVNTAWLIFLGVLSYLLITAAGVTHKDLLLNNDIPLPILQVKIDLARFFFFAPIILVLFHTGVVAQLVLLARKTLEFDTSIRMLETTERRTHPLRLELDNFFFVQGIAGPERSNVMSTFLHGMSWLTLVFLPVLILLYIQVVFIPFHDIGITTAHRVALFADIIMLATIGTFLARSENSFFTAFRRTLAQHPVSALITTGLLAAVSIFSLVFATIPGEPLDRMVERVTGRADKTGGSSFRRSGYLGFTLPFIKPAEDGSLFGLFYRNLVVRDADLVADNAVTVGEASINLRGRDLRFARLDRSDLHQADFTGANLEGASFMQADLRNATLSCADPDRLLLQGDRKGAKCTDAAGADFTRARMNDAKLAGADLTNATLDHAVLEGADMRFLVAPGADFTSANLQRVDMSGNSVLHGAVFLTASLQGADLVTAELTLANFVNANLQGTILASARLEGARFYQAEMEGADLQNAKLFGADFSEARIGHADFRGVFLWRTKPPEADPTNSADLAPITARPPDQLDLASLKDIIARTAHPALKARLEEGLAPVIFARDGPAWASSSEAQAWATLQSSSRAGADGYKQTLSEGLSRLACRAAFANGAVATGVAKRAMRPTFKGDMSAVYNRVRSTDCPASRTLAAKFLAEFGLASDIARGQ